MFLLQTLCRDVPFEESDLGIVGRSRMIGDRGQGPRHSFPHPDEARLRIGPLLGNPSKERRAKAPIGQSHAGRLDCVDGAMGASILFAAPEADLITGHALSVCGGASVGVMSL
jgi:hypothetical protein